VPGIAARDARKEADEQCIPGTDRVDCYRMVDRQVEASPVVTDGRSEGAERDNDVVNPAEACE